MAAHAAGDAEAFGEVVRRHRDRLWAVALRTLRDREEAADALQDALVSAFRSGRRTADGEPGTASGSAATNSGSAFRGDSAVTTWLHRIVVNACLDRVRRRAARPADALPEHDLPDRGPDPLAGRELAIDVEAALATLPDEQRAALVLVDMYGWSVEDAAQALDCATGTVKSRCSRGRARLLPLLRPDIAAMPDARTTGNPADAAGVPSTSATTASATSRVDSALSPQGPPETSLPTTSLQGGDPA
jgi:RNA polymerase sigma-70 factor (ECF subfamily)